MKTYFKIEVPGVNSYETIYFGTPTSDEEKHEMFRLRYRIYVKEKKYIPADFYPTEEDIDDFDKNKKCFYLIAKVDDQIIGTARIIQTWPLPIQNDYFEFSEPKELVKIQPSSKMEIGRIISCPYISKKKNKIPRHLVILGIFWSMDSYAAEKNILGGYGAIKKSAFDKLTKLRFPLHKIKGAKTIFNPNHQNEPLKNFFAKEDFPVPVYFTSEETRDSLKRFFGIRRLFKIVDQQTIRIRKSKFGFLDKILIYLR